MRQKRFVDMTNEEKAQAFVDRVVLDKDFPQCSIDQELTAIENSISCITWRIAPVVEEILKILKTRDDFSFRSFRGIELLYAIKVRYLLWESHGYTRAEVKRLYPIVFEHTGLSLLSILE